MLIDRCRMLAGLILLAALPVAAEDLTIVSQRSRGDGPAVPQTTYMTGARMRMTNPDGKEAIVDYATGAITVIDNKKKDYFVITPADMDAAAAQMKEMRAKMEASMKNMPPALREKMQGAMGGGGAEAVSVERASGGRTIAGYACENWTVTIGTSVRQETCLTRDLQVPVAVFDGLKAMSERMRGVAGPGMAGGMATAWDKFREMKGFPLATTATMKIMGHTETTKTEVTEIRKGPVADSVFQVPAGYKKVESPMAKMGRPGPPK
jgi:Domain of unknown function (DUF4412)